MSLLEQFKWWGDEKDLPVSARHGQMGERAAKRHLQKRGLKYLTANFRSGRGEIDLVFRDERLPGVCRGQNPRGGGMGAPREGGQRAQTPVIDSMRL